MPKATKKSAAKPAKSAAKKRPAAASAKKSAPARKPTAVRPRATTASPARVVTSRRTGKSEVIGLIGSVSSSEVALQAYYIGERRRNLGLPGDAQSDWLEAERRLGR
ncbi:MAG: hypothetical protein ACOYOL_07385 [Chthoniobacterales bacterium]|jgi:hypothetical protein